MATETNSNKIPEFILEAMKSSLEIEYNAIAKEAVEKFESEMMRRRDAVIAGVILNVSRHMNVQEMRDRLVIEIIKVDSTKKEGETV